MTRSTADHQSERWSPNLSDPWPWLLYLPFVLVPWLWIPPSRAQMIGTAIGIVAFLPVYLIGARSQGSKLMAAAAVILTISFALAITGSNWIVVSIFAVFIATQLRPPSRAVQVAILFIVLTGAYALWLGQPLIYWGPGLFIMGMVAYTSFAGTRLEDVNRALLAAQDEVRDLAATAERERIGRDLHDLLGRTLTLVAIKAELAERLSRQDPDSARREMREVAAAARNALGEVRTAVSGMTGASLVRELDASRTALTAANISCSIKGDAKNVPSGAGAVLAMALREAVTNVIRHSGASTCEIRISNGPDECRLHVSDDGLKGREIREGAGISGIRARLKAAGGSLLVEGGERTTCLTASLPSGSRK